MKLLHGILYDLKFQFRHGFYYAYLFVVLVYILLLSFLKQDIKEMMSIIVIFIDPSAIGSFFIGAIILLERSQHTIEALLLTPYKLGQYLVSKVISLSILSLISSLAIALALRIPGLNYYNLIIGVILTSFFFTLLGLIIVSFSKTTNQYFFNSMVVVVFVLPIMEYVNLYQSRLFYLLPGKPALMLISGLFHPLSMEDYIYSIGSLVIWISLAYIIVKQVFYKHVVIEVG